MALSEAEQAAEGESPLRVEAPGSLGDADTITSSTSTITNTHLMNKGLVKHSRHASLDGHEHYSDLKRTTSPLPAIAVQKRRRQISLAPKYHLDERKSSETISSRLSSLSTTSSVGGVAGSTLTPADPETSNKNERAIERLHLQANDQNGILHGKEKMRKVGHRRPSPQRHLSPRRHMSPHGRPNALDFMVQDPEDPMRLPPNNHLPNGPPPGRPVHDGRYRSRSPNNGSPNELSIDETLDGRFPPVQLHQRHFQNGYGSPEVAYSTVEPVAAPFSPPPAHPPFPVQPQTVVPNFQVGALPLSGYDLLAAKLSGKVPGPRLTPMYRRFETLHHRLLLYLQDEIAELEEQLQNLDAADTQSRRFPGGIYPASRRNENISPSEVTWKKNDIINKLAQKLYQYNQVISSFKETQELAEPNSNDISSYRDYLYACNVLAVDEAQFLEATEDLITLAKRRRRSNDAHHDDPLSPRPRSAGMLGFPPSPSSRVSDTGSVRSYVRKSQARMEQAPPTPLAPLAPLALAMSLGVLLPILSFAVIPGFVARMIVVLFVGIGIAAILLQSGLLNMGAENRGAMDWVICAGIYGGVMAVIAGTFS